ncbi:hypothetical protein [Priestia aryabhattai]|uniref:hypothetical protein n=1 Tax=Priestia aryabhattai TaxID=412384 RepID=UPI000BFB963B|nr:hypothetical protein [Priestia aryabhattai]PHF64726.1 hypothetical protein COI42_26570 [Priestia aryabhattai]
MNVELLNAILTNGVALVVGATGAVVAYKGSVKGSMLQIEAERQKMIAEDDEKKKMYKEAIEKFLSNEIKTNFRILNPNGVNYMLDRLKDGRPTQFIFNRPSNGYLFNEYNNLKYELIKVGGEEAKETMAIYEIFYLVNRKKDMGDFTQEEYNQFKKGYNLCLKKYHE